MQKLKDVVQENFTYVRSECPCSLYVDLALTLREKFDISEPVSFSLSLDEHVYCFLCDKRLPYLVCFKKLLKRSLVQKNSDYPKYFDN